MKKTLFYLLVDILGRHRTWLEVVSTNTFQRHKIVRCGIACDVICPVLVVRAFHPHGEYDRGQTWRITSFEIDQAVKRLRQTDKDFSQRVFKEKLTQDDVSRIITDATHGLLVPELSDLPLYTT